MQDEIIIKTPAKINLFLRVFNKRMDGYHNIFSAITFIDLSISQSMLLLIAVTLSIVVIPSGPGHIGLFELAVIGVLVRFFGYSTESAISFSIILHAYSYITYSVIGGYFFIKSNASLDSIK